MATYRAKFIIERVEFRRPMVRGIETPKESVYPEVRIEVSCTDSDIALSKIIGLAQSEQTDRDARKMMPGDQDKKLGHDPDDEFDEDED